MTEWLKLHYALWKLQKEKNRIEKAYTKATHQQAKQQQNPFEEDKNILESEFLFDISIIDETIRALHTRYLCETAYRLMLPLPTEDEPGIWEQAQHDISTQRLLTPKGITELRAAIRKERRESLIIWISLAIGVIGAATGLISVLAC